jgi:hypothetical protein
MRWSLILGWGVLLVLLGGQVSAQEITPSPTATDAPTTSAQYVVAFDAVTYFPVAMFFEFDMILPLETEITVAAITLQSDSLGTLARNLPIEDADVLIQEGALVDLRYFWEFEGADEMPLVFEDVTYTLTLTLSNGEMDQVAGELPFTDHRVQWEEEINVGELPLTLTVPLDVLDPAQVLERLRPIYALLAEEAGAIDEPLEVVLYPSPFTLECLTVDGRPAVVNPVVGPQAIPCEADRARDLYTQSGYFVFELSSASLARAEAALTPLLFDRAYAPLWSGANVPAWFEFGLLTLYRDENDKGQLTLAARGAARNGQLLTLADLREPPVDLGEQGQRVWESQSYGLVVYMAQVYGLEAVFELARSLGTTETFATRFTQQTGDTLDDLFAAWEIWLFTEGAPGVYALNLYAGPTLTPTFTPSATPVTPTRTPLPTSTLTATPTITSTPLPPTETSTVTPRAARDVFTPTPTATPVPPPTATLPVEPQIVQLALMGVAGLAVLLVVVGLLAGRRRR